MPPFDTVRTTLYSTLIETVRLSRTVFDIVSYYTATLYRGAFWNSAIRPSVCPMAQLPRL